MLHFYSELTKHTISGLKYDYNYYNQEMKKQSAVFASRRQRGGFILSRSNLSFSDNSALPFINDTDDPLSSLYNIGSKLWSMSTRRIIRYDQSLLRIKRKIDSLRDELIEKLYLSSYLFYLVDKAFEERKSINSINVMNNVVKQK